MIIRGRKGFTLIELLVVIGILALLAGILFPVLRRARASALQAVCLSNFRQMGAAMSLYLSDNDGYLVLAAHNPNPSATHETDKKWPQLIQPYLPERRLLRCPEDRSPAILPSAYFDEDLVDLRPAEYDYAMAQRTNVGYNYLALSPILETPASRFFAEARSESVFVDPVSQLVAVDSAWRLTNSGKPTGGGHYLVVPPCRFAQVGSIVIDTLKIPNGFRPFFAHKGWRRDQSGFREYGGAYPWHNGAMSTLFLDGHVKTMTASQISKGCDVQENLSGIIRDPESYLWADN